MKTNQIHIINLKCLLMLIDDFSSAVEYYFNKMVELKKCIRNVEGMKIKFEYEFEEKEKNIFGKISGGGNFLI